MKQLYKNQGRSLAGYAAVSISEEDVTLAGRRGNIWFRGGSTYKAVIRTGAENEKIYSFHIKDLKRWLKRIGWEAVMAKQVQLANHPEQWEAQ